MNGLSGLVEASILGPLSVLYVNGFSLKIGNNESMNFGGYYLQYVPASKPFDRT
jgi:hypothetical protein